MNIFIWKTRNTNTKTGEIGAENADFSCIFLGLLCKYHKNNAPFLVKPIQMNKISKSP